MRGAGMAPVDRAGAGLSASGRHTAAVNAAAPRQPLSGEGWAMPTLVDYDPAHHEDALRALWLAYVRPGLTRGIAAAGG
jgi:hypothetical protein